jgi:guanylate kinase
MIKRKAFVEWAEVHGNHYGTSADQIDERLGAGVDVVCDIDVQGGAAVRKIFGPDRSILIFVLPPSMGELERRLRSRGTDSDDVIERRLARARQEHERAHTYDYLVVNDDFSAASAAIADIVRGERLRTSRVLPKLPAGLLGRIRGRLKA